MLIDVERFPFGGKWAQNPIKELTVRERAVWPLIALSMSAVATAIGATPGPYRLEKTHVDLLFSINHAGFTQKHGSFRDLDATLHYDPHRPDQSQISVTVETASLDTGDGKRDRDVKSPQFLDVGKYPQMRFVSTKVTPGPGGTLLVEGNLTLHGVTKPF